MASCGLLRALSFIRVAIALCEQVTASCNDSLCAAEELHNLMQVRRKLAPLGSQAGSEEKLAGYVDGPEKVVGAGDPVNEPATNLASTLSISATLFVNGLSRAGTRSESDPYPVHFFASNLSYALLAPLAAVFVASLAYYGAWLISSRGTPGDSGTRLQTESKPITEEDAVASALADGPVHWRHFTIYLCTMLSYMVMGSVNDPIGILFPAFKDEWGAQDPHTLALTSTGLAGGLIISNIFSGALCDTYGRLMVSRIGAVIAVLSVCMGTRALSIHWFALSRVLGGLGMGATNVGLSTLLSEVLPTERRILLVLYQCGWPLGAAMFTLNFVSFTTWRLAVAANGAAALMMLILLVVPGAVVESPRFLFSSSRRLAAKEALIKYGATWPLSSGEKYMEAVNAAVSDSMGKGSESQLSWIMFGLFNVAFACQSVASQLVKVWLPDVLVMSGALTDRGNDGVQTFAIMWSGECMGIMLMGLAFGGAERKNSADSDVDFRPLYVASISFLAGAVAVATNLIARGNWVLGFLGCCHLLGQACAFNFLFAFACLALPIAVRARCISCFYAVAFAGVFVGPFVGSTVLSGGNSKRDAKDMILVATGIYFAGALACLSIHRLMENARKAHELK